MAEAIDTRSRAGPHPLHLVLVVSSLPLFLGALVSDWAYSSTFHVQWTNFASWLIAGGTLFAGCALLWAALRLFRRSNRRGRSGWVHLLLVAATFVFALLNAVIHAKDGWAAMPEGFILSGVVLLLSAAAVWTAFTLSPEGR